MYMVYLFIYFGSLIYLISVFQHIDNSNNLIDLFLRILYIEILSPFFYNRHCHTFLFLMSFDFTFHFFAMQGFFLRCPSADEWLRKLWYIYTMECYSAIKKNTFESFLMRWMKLEPIIQSEVSQKEKHQYSILMHIYGI